MKRLLIIVLFAASARAQVVAMAGRDTVVAHDGRVELFDANLSRVWSAEGVADVSRVVVGQGRVAVIDSFANTVAIIDLANGNGERIATGETPVDAAFAGGDLFILDRDANRLQRAGGGSVTLAPDPAYLRAAGGRLLVYSRLEGVVQEIDPRQMRITRKLAMAPFASDFETDGHTGYLVYPGEAKLRTFSVPSMTATGDVGAGVVPVDLAVASRANVLSASRLALADPSAKRVWIVEGSESVSRAVTRGFLRGLLGLGLFSPQSSQFPTGVDRVMTRGSITLAYDSTSRTLYRVRGSKGTAIATDVAPGGFAIASTGVTVWQKGVLRLIR